MTGVCVDGQGERDCGEEGAGHPPRKSLRSFAPPSLCERGGARWLLVGVGVYYAVESGGAFVDPFGGVGEEEFDAEV